MTAAPRFSIVIPTADRHELLEKTIAACLLSRYPNLEVLISDNCSSSQTADVVNRFGSDQRVRYVRTAHRMSMPDHWEFAWPKATGDYIIVNGDDDAFASTLIDQLAIIALEMRAGLISWDAGVYYHPDWKGAERNSFVFPNFHSGLLLDIDPQAVIASYARLDIPAWFPQGTRICFSRRIADRAVARTGRLFWPPYPDYSAPLLLLGLLDDEAYVYFDSLQGYGGRSSESNAASLEPNRAKIGNQRRIRQFYDEFQGKDLYPHQVLKFKSLWNGHAETLNLLRSVLPESFASYAVDATAFIAAIECEFRGIAVYNQFLGTEERMSFDKFIQQQDPDVVRSAMRIVHRRLVNYRIESWRADPKRISWPVLKFIITELSVLKMAPRLLHATRGLFSQPAPAATTCTAGADGRNLVVKRRGGKVHVNCASFDGKDGLDLVRKLHDVVAACDRRDFSAVSDLFANEFLLAAHHPDHILSGARKEG